VSPKLTAETRPIILAIHPHGIANDYRILMDGMLYEALPNRNILTLAATVVFAIPLVRELALWTRCIDARKSVAVQALAAGHSLLVLPGGEAEQIATEHGVEEVYLATRMGFVKLAMQADVGLVPCYAFGTVDLYKVYTGVFDKQREWLRKKTGVCVPVFSGSCLFLPLQVPVDVVMGDPVVLPPCREGGKPTDAEVVAAHAVYVAALRSLFDAQKGRFGYADRELTVK
jgi:hypothetical protein